MFDGLKPCNKSAILFYNRPSIISKTGFYNSFALRSSDLDLMSEKLP
jgi:hypothetical protein